MVSVSVTDELGIASFLIPSNAPSNYATIEFNSGDPYAHFTYHPPSNMSIVKGGMVENVVVQYSTMDYPLISGQFRLIH